GIARERQSPVAAAIPAGVSEWMEYFKRRPPCERRWCGGLGRPRTPPRYHGGGADGGGLDWGGNRRAAPLARGGGSASDERDARDRIENAPYAARSQEMTGARDYDRIQAEPRERERDEDESEREKIRERRACSRSELRKEARKEDGHFRISEIAPQTLTK